MIIELYSVRGFTGSALKKKLEMALEKDHLSYVVQETNHVDQFIKAGLISVPAFKIGDKIIPHPHDGDPDDTVAKVMDYLLDEKVNRILVPVDFSEESLKAIEYAGMMAQHLDMGITLTHIHQTLYDPITFGALDVQMMEENNKKLMELADQLNRENQSKGITTPVLAYLEVGEATSTLIEILDRGHFEMMIMGTKAIDNAVRRFFGTVSSEVSRRSEKPVIVVPPQAEIKFPGKMVVGFTEELLINGVIECILSFGAKNNVFFDFVRVTDNLEEFNTLKNELYQKLMLHQKLLSGFNIRSLTEEEHKIHEVLFKHVNEVMADMLILVSHHRPFLENIRHSSVTKKALQNPPVPLMIIHHPLEIHAQQNV